MATQSVAFLGLGHMGARMAANLVKAGIAVTGYDPVPAALEAGKAAGVTPAATAVEAVAGADVIISMLPSGELVLDLYRQIVPAAAAGTTFIDCSTIDVASAREAADAASAAGHRALDAPVSGGVAGAEAGTLAFMVGGDAETFALAEPLLDIMGRKVVHCGGSGNGQAAKICNNLILGASMIAVSEAFVLGERLGLDHQALFDVASNASGQCWALTSNCPVPGPLPTSPANRDYQPGFATALMNKDLGLAMDAANSTGTATELGAVAAERYRQFHEGGSGGLDFSAVVLDVRDRSTQEDDA